VPVDTADRILKTAHTLIVNRGYSAFSYADISEILKISKANIHHHFPTKAGLVVVVLNTYRGRVELGTEALDQQFEDPMMRLEAYVQHWERCIRGKKEPFCVAALLAAELPGLPQEVRAEVRLHFESLCTWIQRTMEAGLRKKSLKLQYSPQIEAQMLMALVHGAMLSARVNGKTEVFRTVTSTALQRLSIRKRQGKQ
jgi:TetR/AcrR family transcriptional repressor of nem operon